MKDTQTRKYEAFLRVQEFGNNHAARIPTETIANELFTRLDEIIEQTNKHSSAQSSGLRAAREGGTIKEVRRAALHALLKGISRTAKSLPTPGMSDKFRVPSRLKDQDLLSLARSIAADAAPIRIEFIRRGLPANFIDNLSTLITNFEQAVDQMIQSEETRVAATAAIKDLVQGGMNVLRQLDPIMRNVFVEDPATLASWGSARHVERTSRSKRTDKTPASTAP
ncbi:MAG TPA: hypothetical protein VF708_02205 [Pyrinomonadaceae bacterium]|jgi:hypothetical protein